MNTSAHAHAHEHATLIPTYALARTKVMGDSYVAVFPNGTMGGLIKGVAHCHTHA